jgi:2-C-methyl-D-erythritol 4-phosphate cytidylyltransferase
MPDAGSSVAVVIVAAGSGERLGASIPKALIELGGRPMITYSVLTVAAADGVRSVVLTAPPAHVDAFREIVAALPVDADVEIVAGGPTRQASVRQALEAVPSGVLTVVCHDAARPFASGALFERVIAAVRLTSPGSGAVRADGAIPVLRPPDTVKRLEGDVVAGTIPRTSVGLAQTPQAFSTPRLREAHAAAVRTGLDGTDDAMLLEAAGMRVVTVAGEAENLKITTREDLEFAERMIVAAR